MSIKKTDTLN